MLWGKRQLEDTYDGSCICMTLLLSRSIGVMNGTTILEILARSKNLPSLAKVAPREDHGNTSAPT